MVSDAGFPDHVHLERLASALWGQPGAGRAAVMVGAGLSLNTRQVSSSARPMLTWSQLSGRLVDAMYPPAAPLDEARRRAMAAVASPGGFLRIAEEAEALLGRDALDSLIAAAVPDLDHEPGPLHDLLLRLPWAEVLTTNFDTLLERAAARARLRRYSVVNTPEDIGPAARPRVVKLHGSLPSARPFVLTEEDFRLYPSRNPAFVNLARQSILENALCLIGFSGDDPNFLQWSGWVRDILRGSARRVYLCGILDLSTAQRRLLSGRNIVPIDLSPMFPTDIWPEDKERRASAVEWLLLALATREPPDPLAWPGSGAPPRVDLPPGFPPLPPGPPNPVVEEAWKP